MSDELATDAQGFYARFGEGDDSVAHVNGNPDMSEETLGALRAVFQAAYDAAQRGELKALDEAKDAHNLTRPFHSTPAATMSDTIKQPPMRQVTDFLVKRGGHRLATFSDVETTNDSIIHAWGVRGRVVMIHDYAGDNGVEVYIPAAGETNSIPHTLDALKEYVNQ